MLSAVRILVAAAVVFAALAVSSNDAQAQKRRIVVLSIEDSPNPKLRKSLVSILGRARHTVISAKTFNKTARRLRARTMTSDNLVKVARRLRADGVLSGSVTEENGRYYLRLHLRSGRTGDTVQKLRLKLRRARLSKKIQRQLRKQLLAAVRQLRPPVAKKRKRRNTGGGDEIEVVDGVRATTKKKKTPNGSKNGTQTNNSQASNGGADNRGTDPKNGAGTGNGQTRVSTAGNGGLSGQGPSNTEPSNTLVGSIAPDREPAKVREAANLRVGASIVQRNMSFVLVEDFPQAPNDYIGPLAPGLSVAGDVYPLELTGAAGTILAAPGFAFRYDTVLGLQTAIDTGGAVAATAPTEQTSYSIGGRLRFRLNFLPADPVLTIGGGIGQLSFMVDPNAVPAGIVLDVPNTTYKYFDPGAWLKLSVHPKIDVEVGGQALLVTDAGQVQDADQYGGANITSYALDLGVEYSLTPNWRVRANGSYTSLGLAFIGNGAQTRGRDGDDTDVEVLGAKDSYLGGSIALGYVY